MKKKTHPSLILRLLALIFITLSVHPATTPPTTGPGAFVLSQVKDSSYNLKQAANIVTQQVGSGVISQQLEDLRLKLNSVKEKLGITQAEQQLKSAQDALDQAIITLYNKAFDKQNSSLYQKLYAVIQDIFNDPIIKEKTNVVIELYQEMTQRIMANPNTVNHWTKQIQEAGQTINKLAAEQEKAIDPILTQAQTLQNQLTEARQANPQLMALEQKLYQKNIDLQQAFNELPTSIKTQIKQLQDSSQKSNFLLQFIQDPRKAATARPETILKQETNPAFATNK